MASSMTKMTLDRIAANKKPNNQEVSSEPILENKIHLQETNENIDQARDDNLAQETEIIQEEIVTEKKKKKKNKIESSSKKKLTEKRTK